jgi:hypothetical protein
VCFAITLVSCGGTSGRVGPDQPLLEPSPTAAAVPSDAPPIAMTVLIDRDCVRAGTYTMAFDTLAMSVTTAGTTPRDRCVELAERIVPSTPLEIDHDGPRVKWNEAWEPMVATDACAFTVKGKSGELAIQFRGGTGRGIADLTLGGGCTARDVRVTVTSVL